MTEEILKLAKECFHDNWTPEDYYTVSPEQIEAFYRAAFNAGVDAAARLAYGTGDEQMEAQIRALKEMK